MAPKLCRDCEASKLLIQNLTATWRCAKTGRHKTFADTCDLTKPATSPHPLLGTLDGYIEAARCKTLNQFQEPQQ